jgi:hypothetical protein
MSHDLLDVGPARPDVRTSALTDRDRAILRAVAGGTAELLGDAHPDLFVDGRSCCDQMAVRRLAHAGLITGAGQVGAGRRVPARLTPAGHLELLAS